MLSAVIITKNEEKNIARCLQSLAGVADEIVVADSFSTDRTKEICESFGVRFMQVQWLGYAATKNMADNAAANDWILSIDADEALSEALKNTLLQLKKTGFGHNIYAFRRLTNYCGQWIKHGGWYPDTKDRLFNRNQARWTGEYVHERLEYDAGLNPVLLDGDLLHYSIPDIASHINTVNRYSSLAADELIARGKKFSLLKLLFSPPMTFLKMYIFKAGFLDGLYGFVIALISSHYRFLKYAKMINSHQSTVSSQQDK